MVRDSHCPACGARIRRTHRCRGPVPLVTAPDGWRLLQTTPDPPRPRLHPDQLHLPLELEPEQPQESR